MTKKGSSSISRALVLDNPTDIVLDFSKISHLSTKSQEIRKSLLTGTHTKNHKIHPANIVLSALRDLISHAGSFEYVDFKDSFVERSAFDGSSFDYAAIINCQFEGVVFSSCHFHNVSITGSIFHEVRFENCALDHMVIESCKFLRCNFINCTTSNKLFDYCLFHECSFEETNLQVQTLTGNFGITKECLVRSKIRDRSIDEDFKFIGRSSLKKLATTTPIEAFKIAYFLDQDIALHGSEEFDATFNLANWLGTAKIPLTFTNLLSIYADFLISLYDDHRIFIFPILKLHSLTGMLVERASVPSSIMTSVYGVHMNLSRIVEKYLAVVTSYVRSLDASASILVNGPLEEDYYLHNFPYLFDHPNLTINQIRKHNSPNEIFLSWDSAATVVPIVAAFMASRFKFEITPYQPRTIEAAPEVGVEGRDIVTPGQTLVPVESLFELRVGFEADDSHLYGLKLKSIFPGNLLVELGIHLSVRKIAAVRDLIVGILSSGQRETR